MLIQICGPGCAKCHETLKTVQQVVAELGVAATVEKVTDFQAIARLGIFATPAVVIDGQVKCVGKVPTSNEVRGWLG
ncbi:MAG: thioredoxin family protein [Deltaproteobacteria bacterium CG_4_10_14_3_um_filter_60_8]|nr:MAG: thioredoxin family protein [Desulfobacterales bacterium CG2_30_60_27]PIP44635.1 MAG: thioredoxin family protein [Deltaproteobacteria bacterium CG23_combo_of_CG06-09_8_20_14_all_60_8]PIY21097.1 MAG: thioredoxin family protein [Deltaproteobacteria bacterium CG_4_10_14_3_um_filter_60_8]